MIDEKEKALHRLQQIEARIGQELDLLDELSRNVPTSVGAQVAQTEILREVLSRLRVEHCLLGGVRRVLGLARKAK